jgi:hypothetical protein
MPVIQHYQIVATLAEFEDFDSFSGGEFDIAQTDYTPAGRKAPIKLPGTHSFTDVTLSRAFDPTRDRKLIDWFNRYQAGQETHRSCVVKFYSAQGVIIDSMTYPICKPQKITTPNGKSGDNTPAEISITLSVEALQ